MKRLVFFVFSVAVLSACSKGSSDVAPEVSNPPHNILSARIADYGTSHIWKEGDLFGLYGSISGDNVRYVVEPVSYEKDGNARIYGSGVDGEVYGYYPYDEEDGCPAAALGRQPLAAQQAYWGSAREQVMQSTVLVAKLDNEVLSFSWVCGVLHLHITAGVNGTVRAASLSSGDVPLCGDYSIIGADPLMANASGTLTVTGIGRLCEPETPLDVYFMLPPGVYSSLSLTLTSDEESVTKPVDLTVAITSMAEVNCTVSEKETVYEGTDLIIIDGEFDD